MSGKLISVLLALGLLGSVAIALAVPPFFEAIVASDFKELFKFLFAKRKSVIAQ
jgi:hypothetical protein